MTANENLIAKPTKEQDCGKIISEIFFKENVKCTFKKCKTIVFYD